MISIFFAAFYHKITSILVNWFIMRNFLKLPNNKHNLYSKLMFNIVMIRILQINNIKMETYRLINEKNGVFYK